MKKIVSSLVMVLFGLFIFSNGAFAAEKGYGEKIDVKVMSYNIHHGVGIDGVLSLERIADVIRDSGAEIIGLQEVDRYYGARSDFQDQAKRLAQLLGYHYVYGANLNLPPAEGQTENRQYGTAILSKYPIIYSENIHLSSFGREQRGVLFAKINVRGIHIGVYNTHLSLNATDRLTQVAEIVELTLQYNGPKVLVGDFNALPDSAEVQYLIREGNFTDTFEDVEDNNTFPPINPDRRIDYIFTSKGIEFSNQQVIHTEASDHLPILTQLTIYRK